MKEIGKYEKEWTNEKQMFATSRKSIELLENVRKIKISSAPSTVPLERKHLSKWNKMKMQFIS